MFVKNQEELSELVSSYKYDENWGMEAEKWKPLFTSKINKKLSTHIRSHIMTIGYTLINFKDNTANLMGLFTDIYDIIDNDITTIEVLRRWISVIERYKFKFGFAVHSFCFDDNLTPHDKFIQTIKIEMMLLEQMKKRRQYTTSEYLKRVNSDEIIKLTKERVSLLEKRMHETGLYKYNNNKEVCIY